MNPRRPDPPSDAIESAVERFVRACSTGAAPDVDTFAAEFPAVARASIVRRCRAFLEFDALVGSDDIGVADDDDPARQLGEFRIVDELGRGGMGVVHLAEHDGDTAKMPKRVALKVLSRGLSFSARHVERFRREVRALAALDHPGIVPVYASGEADGCLYYAMEFVSGRDVGEVIDAARHDGVPPRLGLLADASLAAEAAELTASVAEVLASAHAAGVVHRDVKPSNLLIGDDGIVRVVDFGLAKMQVDETSVSLTGELTGTPHYMSPEQTLARRVPIDHRTDVFSLGVVLYELLTMHRPFGGEDLQELVYSICFRDPAPVQKLAPDAPRDLVTICQRALEKDPADRYQGAGEMAADLRRFLAHRPIAARPPGIWRRARRLLGRNRLATGIAAVAIVVGSSVLLWSWIDAAGRADRAAELRGEAEHAAADGEFDRAVRVATEAVRFAPADRQLGLLLERYQEAAARSAAEASAFLARSAEVLEDDPELALRFALDGADREESSAAREAVLHALSRRFEAQTWRLEANVSRAAWSPDGSRVAIVGHDGRAGLCPLTASDSDRPIMLEGHREWVSSVAWSPDGTRLVTGSNDKTARIWDAATGEQIASIGPHRARVDAVDFAADGSVLSASHGSEVRVVRPDGSELRRELEARLLQRAGFTPDGRHVVLFAATPGSKAHREVLVLDAATLETVGALGPHGGWVDSIAVSGDSAHVATACRDGGVRLFRLEDAALVREWRHTDKARCVRFSPDGRYLASCSEDRTVRLWDLETGAEARTFTGHDGPVWHLAFDADGRRLVTSGDDGKARVWEVATGRTLAVLSHEDPVYAASFAPDGDRVVVRAGTDDVRIWRVVGERAALELGGHRDLVYSTAFTPDGRGIATGAADGRVRLFRSTDGGLERVVQAGESGVRALVFSGDGQRLFAASGNRVVAIDVESLDAVEVLGEHRGRVGALSLGAGASRLVSAGGEVLVFDVTGDDIRVVDTIEQPRPVGVAAIDPEGARLATAADDFAVRLWSFPDLEPQAVLRGHRDTIKSIRFSADGGRVLTASLDRTACLWDTSTGALLHRFDEHEGSCNAALFVPRPDGEPLVLTASGDRVARLWDTDGNVLMRFDDHGNKLTDADVTADGRFVVTSSFDWTARVRILDPIGYARGLDVRRTTWAERDRFGLLTEVDRRARVAVDELMAEHVLADTVYSLLQSPDTALDPAVQTVAVEIAQEWDNPPPMVLDRKAYTLVRPEAVDPDDAEHARRIAEAACRAQENNGFFHGTAGLALLRLGASGEAVARLRQATELQARTRYGVQPETLRWLCRALHDAGERELAFRTLDELRQLVAKPRFAGDTEVAALVGAVESELAGAR